LIIVQVTKCGWLSEYITLYLLLPIVAIEGLLVGWGEAEPLDMRYQAEPGNEGRAWERGISCLNYHTRDRNNAVNIKILILLYKLLVNPQKFAASVLHPHQATKARIFCF